ncbi:hypothetical protein H671_2g4890 [Cricetulus griseus]|nr:hypothetical protein H671_2g4890 [Cricetulus griseus]
MLGLPQPENSVVDAGNDFLVLDHCYVQQPVGKEQGPGPMMYRLQTKTQTIVRACCNPQWHSTGSQQDSTLQAHMTMVVTYRKPSGDAAYQPCADRRRLLTLWEMLRVSISSQKLGRVLCGCRKKPGKLQTEEQRAVSGGHQRPHHALSLESQHSALSSPRDRMCSEILSPKRDAVLPSRAEDSCLQKRSEMSHLQAAGL